MPASFSQSTLPVLIIVAAFTMGFACARPEQPASGPATAQLPASSSSPSEAGAPSGLPLAPPFRVRASDGRLFDSAALAQPIVLLFFTSWCPVCARELPRILGVLQREDGAIVALGVSLDDDTWPDVDAFMKRMAPWLPVVRGASYARFVDEYDPGGAFPAVVVIDARRHVVLSQQGARDNGAALLELALDEALGRVVIK